MLKLNEVHDSILNINGRVFVIDYPTKAVEESEVATEKYHHPKDFSLQGNDNHSEKKKIGVRQQAKRMGGGEIRVSDPQIFMFRRSFFLS